MCVHHRRVRAALVAADTSTVAGEPAMAAPTDATRAMEKLLSDRFGPRFVRDRTDTWSGAQATVGNLRDRVLAAAEAARVGDLFVLQFSGEGEASAAGEGWVLAGGDRFTDG